MKANPTWKALVEKKRTELNQSKKPTEQANVTLGGEAFGFFTTPAMPTNDNEIPTEKRWVVDTGAQVHVCNDRRLFVTFEDAQSVVKVGDTETSVKGIGTIVIYGVSPVTKNPVRMELYNTRYSPNFHSNLISHGLMKASLLVNFRSNCIETTEGRQVYQVYQDQKLTWLTQP